MTPGDIDAGRGGSAFGGLVRLAFTLSPMTKEMAEALGVENPKGIIRIDYAKGNYLADPGEANWYRFKSIDLENESFGNSESDTVGILVPWVAPGLFEHVTYPQIDAALDAIGAGFEDGERYTFAPQSKERYVALPIAEALDVAAEKAERVMKVWRGSGLLFEKQYPSAKHRKLKSGVFVDGGKRPSAMGEYTDLSNRKGKNENGATMAQQWRKPPFNTAPVPGADSP